MLQITGDTYRLRKLFGDLGGKWDRKNRRWELPDAAEEIVTRIAAQYGCQVTVQFVPDEGKGECLKNTDCSTTRSDTL